MTQPRQKIMKSFLVLLLVWYSASAKGPCGKRLEQYLTNEQGMPGAAEPFCETDGTFSPKQCRGAGCYCVEPDGTYIGYFITYGSGTDRMDCKCAVDQAAYRKTGLLGKIFSCDSKGSYGRIQCHGSVCFCSDAVGEPIDISQGVNIADINTLNC